MSSSHKDAIDANKKTMNAQMALKYDKRESIEVLSLLFVKAITEFDPKNPIRKSVEESGKVIGDSHKRLSGFSASKTLLAPSELKSKFPNSLIKPGINILDFACGTGMVTQYFAQYLASESIPSEIVGIDISPGFLNKFISRMSMYKSPTLKISSYLCDILDKNEENVVSGLKNKFDVIICTISYHHIDNYRDVTKKLATFLKPGGTIFILDFYNEDVENSNISKSGAVRHMGGLRIDTITETMSEYSKLCNVSVAREFIASLWQHEQFIRNHMTERTIKRLDEGSLESRNEQNEIQYNVNTSVIMAIGQRPNI